MLLYSVDRRSWSNDGARIDYHGLIVHGSIVHNFNRVNSPNTAKRKKSYYSGQISLLLIYICLSLR